jgi:RNA polymerase sigma factor (sigma-70 family)
VSSELDVAASDGVMTTTYDNLFGPPVLPTARSSEPEPEVIAEYSTPTFATFYATNYRRAVALASVLTGSRNAAEDLVQDAMADAHRRWPTISQYDNPTAWLNRAIANRSVSLRRRLLVRDRGLAKLQSGTAEAVDLEARDGELWQRVRRLPARQSQLVALVYVERLSVAEAADTLGIGLPTAKTHLARAKERLARDLKDWNNS